MGLREEILEQPEVTRRLLARRGEIDDLADRLRSHSIEYVFLTARGTSDNAGLYAKYVWGVFNHLPVALAAPSLFGPYGAPPRLGRALVLGISQSGQSPDIVRVVEGGRDQGVPTLVITNDPRSPLAAASEHVFELEAGPELAVAATKTYTSQLIALAMLSASLADDEARWTSLAGVPEQMEAVLGSEQTLESAAERLQDMEHCVVIGRGFNLATAFEWSLKLKELAYVVAAPYSSADFRHGPIAVVDRDFPVLAMIPRGAVRDDLVDLLERLVGQHHAQTLVLSDDETALSFAQIPVALPPGLEEWLSPIVGIVAAQLFTYHLTSLKGLDTEQPRGLRKITRSD